MLNGNKAAILAAIDVSNVADRIRDGNGSALLPSKALKF